MGGSATENSAHRHGQARAAGELDARKAAVLEAVVTEYIGSAQPVGSQHVAEAAGINVSSATVRSEMVALEHDGYLVQPHTSAGRIPTDKGYRFFVDQLAEPGALGPAQRQKVSRFFDHVHGEMEQMLERTSGLLSDLTSYASVVLPPGHESAPVRSVQLVGLGPRLALLVAVLADGAVEKRTIDLAEEVPDEVLAAAAAQVHVAAQGHPLGQRPAPATTGDPTVDRIAGMVATTLGELVAEDHDRVFVGGPSRLAAAFDAVETVRSVLGILEQQLVVVSLLRDVLERGLSVAIGAEHGYEPLASCAVVVAPVSIDGHDAGAVGLLGPTRMNYPQALAAAQMVSERLGEHLGGGRGGADGETTRETGREAARERRRRHAGR
ncbi:MAG: heat-inducible transcriptional repressor HrcA [Acidimicrobiales bacterium]